ncbi:MAG: IPT/TIG domain-containing protein [Actinobacteria bacterium]|nr:IPT/TIG domain-containing protein [Actinomycetota bacterium]
MSVDFGGKYMSAYERWSDKVQESNKGPFMEYDRGGHKAVDEQETISSQTGTVRSAKLRYFSRAIASVSIALMAGLGMLPFLGSTAFAATSVTINSGPSPSPATAGASSLYTVGFTTSGSGALASGSGTITLAGPTGTVFPSSASAYTVNGIAVSATPSLSNSNATATITTPTAVADGTSVTVVANGVTNPPAGTYTMAVSTSADTAPVNTSGYTISAVATSVTNVTGPSPSGPNSNYAGDPSIYTIGFKTSSTGAIAASTATTPGTITLIDPTGKTTWPATPSYFTVNNVAATGVSSSCPSGTVTGATCAVITNPLTTTIPDSASVTVVVYDVTNPTSAGSYTLDVSTSSDAAPVATSSYSIVTAPTEVGSVTLTTSPDPSAVLAGGGSNDLITFSATSGIASNGSITLTGPTGTAFPTAPSSYTVNSGTGGVAATTITGGGTDSVTISNPVGTISSGTTVTVNVIGVTNTTTAGSTDLYVSDSTDQAPAKVAFNVATEVTSVSGPNPTSLASGAIANYTYSFTTGSTGALTAGTDTITLVAPSASSTNATAGTAFPTSGTDYTVNGVAASGTVTPVTSGPIVMATITTPVSVADSSSVTVVVAGVTNPTVSSNTAELGAVLTSANDYPSPSSSYTITSATAVSDVSASDSSGTYSISFTSTSGIKSGGSISIVAPSGVEFPSATGSYTVTNTTATSSVTVSSVPVSGSNSVTLDIGTAVPATDVVSVSVSVTTDAATGRYQLSVDTSSDTTPVNSNWYDVPSSPLSSPQFVTGVTGPSISPNSFATTPGNQYVLSFNTSSTGGLNIDDTITLTSTAGSALPTIASDYVVNGVAAVSLAASSTTDVPVIDLPVSVGASATVTIVISGVTNPAAGSYAFSVKSSIDSKGLVPGPSYTIVALPGSVVSPGLKSSNNAAGQSALYTVGFTTSSTGGSLAAGTGTITLATSPSGTVFPSSATAYTVNGVVASTVALSNSDATVTITTPTDVAGGASVAVVINGVTNGPVVMAPSTTYSMDITTSSDSCPLGGVTCAYGTSPLEPSISVYTGLSKVTGPMVSNLAADPTTAQYVYGFTTSATGGLVDTTTSSILNYVYVVVPPAATGGTATGLPTSSASDFVVDGIAAHSAAATCPSALPAALSGWSCAQVELQPLQSIADSAAGTLVINGVTNPSPGTYSEYLSTSADQAVVPTSSYTIESAVSSPSVSMTLKGSGESAQYTVGFSTSSSGALSAGTGTITLAAPAGTVFPSAASAYTVSVNSGAAVAASTVALSNSDSTATITTPTAVGVTMPVSIVIVGVVNPPAGTYMLNVNTSADLAPSSTGSYQITGAVSSLTGPSPSPATPATSATYTVGFTTSTTGALAAGSGTITLTTSPSGTIFPSAASDYTVGGTAVTTLSGGGTSAVTITTPIAIGNSSVVKVAISGVTNPSSGSYTMAVNTSSDTVPVDTASYAIGSSVSSVTGPSPSSNLAGVSATYTVGFTTSSSGALAANSGTITFTAPSGTVFPTSAGDYTVNATAAATVSGGGTDTVTITSPVAVADSTAVTVAVSGVTNPAMGSYTLGVNTSTDIVPVNTSSYTIIALPTVSGISPVSGPTSGGTAVTITGTNFASGATVMFGAVTATAATVSSSTSIVATSPAESAGTVNVTVTTAGGTSATSSADQFTYVVAISGDAYTPVNPMRLADTRCSASPAPSYCAGENLPSANASLGTLAAGKSENVAVTGVDAIPLTATAVVVNVTAVNMTGGGYLSIYPEGSTPAVVSSLNWTSTTKVVTNLVTVPVNTSNGEISVANGGTSGAVNYIVDIEGYYAPPGSTPAGLYNAVTPTRLADSRCSESPLPTGITSSYCSAIPSANGKLVTLGAGKTENVTVTGVGPVPSSGVSAVVLNLTAVNTSSSGYFTAYPAGASKATVSTVNWIAGQTVPNRVIVEVGANGAITLYNNSGTANFIVDVSGYYTDGSSTSQTGSLFNPVTPARIVDTRCSVSSAPSFCASENLPSANATLGAVSAGKSITAQVTGIDSIPSSATAFVGNVTATGGTGGGYLTVYSGSTAPTTSDVNFGVGTTSANMVIGGLTSSGTVNIANGGGSGSVNVLVDVSGWFTAATS